MVADAGSGVTDITIGFMRIMRSESCRNERTCSRVMCLGILLVVWMVVVVLKSGEVYQLKGSYWDTGQLTG